MYDFIEEVWEVLVALWNISNYWTRMLVRAVILVVFGWPIILTIIAAFVESVAVKTWLALVPALFVIIAAMIFRYPLIIAAVAAFDHGRRILKGIVAALGWESLYGFVLVLVPVHNDPGLLFILLLIAFVLMFSTQFPTPWNNRVRSLMLTSAGVIILLFFLGGRSKVMAWWDSENEDRPKTESSTSTTTAELPSLIGLLRSGENIVQCEGAQDVRLEDDGSEHVTIPLRPCRSGYYTLPTGWSGFRFESEPDGELIIWDLSGRRIDIPPGVSKPIRNPGRSFQIAGPSGALHLYPKKVRDDTSRPGILERLVGNTQVAPPSAPSKPEELQTTEGTVVQWYPGEKALILRSKEGNETQFQATRDALVTVGNKTYGLGNQWILSAREGYLLDPGDVIRVRYYESTKNIVGIELLEPAKKELPAVRRDGIQFARIEPLPTDEPPPGKILYGVISRIDDKTFLVQTSSGYELVDVTENTMVISGGKQCYFEALRVGDPVRIIYLAGTNTVLKIDVVSDPETGNRPEGNPFEAAYWKKNYFPSSR